MLLYALFSVDLASHSQALTRYEPSSINWFRLASYVKLNSLACWALDAFHIQPRQTLHFWFVRRIWTFCRFFNRELLYQMSYNNLLRWAASVAPRNFVPQNTTHHVPFASRATQSSFAIGVYACYHTYPLTTKTALDPLDATLRNQTLPFLIPTNWLVL